MDKINVLLQVSKHEEEGWKEVLSLSCDVNTDDYGLNHTIKSVRTAILQVLQAEIWEHSKGIELAITDNREEE